jgi:hypothetical protein
MERIRQSEIRRQLDLVAKVTLVNNMKVNIEENFSSSFVDF